MVIEIDPALAGDDRAVALRALSALVQAAHAEITDGSTGSLLAFINDQAAADRLAAAVRATGRVAAAYVKPPDAMP